MADRRAKAQGPTAQPFLAADPSPQLTGLRWEGHLSLLPSGTVPSLTQHATALLPTVRGFEPQPASGPLRSSGVGPAHSSTLIPSLPTPTPPHLTKLQPHPHLSLPQKHINLCSASGLRTCCSLCQECFALGWLLGILQSSAPQGAFPDHPFLCILQHRLPISSTKSSLAWNKCVDLLVSRWCPRPTRVGWSRAQPSTWHLRTPDSHGHSLKVPGTPEPGPVLPCAPAYSLCVLADGRSPSSYWALCFCGAGRRGSGQSPDAWVRAGRGKRPPHLPGAAETLPWAHLWPTPFPVGSISHLRKQGMKNDFANLDVLLHRGHRPDAEALGKLDSGLWSRGLLFTLDQLKHNPPRDRRAQTEMGVCPLRGPLECHGS